MKGFNENILWVLLLRTQSPSARVLEFSSVEIHSETVSDKNT